VARKKKSPPHYTGVACPSESCGGGRSDKIREVSDPSVFGIPAEILAQSSGETMCRCSYCDFIWFGTSGGYDVIPIGWGGAREFKAAGPNVPLKPGRARQRC